MGDGRRGDLQDSQLIHGLLGPLSVWGNPEEGIWGEGNVTGAGRGRGGKDCLTGTEGVRPPPALQAACGRIPGGKAVTDSQLPPGREKRPFRILWCLAEEQGRGPLAACPAIWRPGRRAPRWPRLPQGTRAPTPPAAPSLPEGGHRVVARHRDGHAEAGPWPVAPPSIPGAQAAMTHISAPAACSCGPDISALPSLSQ